MCGRFKSSGCVYLLLVALIGLAGCGGAADESKFARIHKGMTLAEVEAIMSEGEEQYRIAPPGQTAETPGVPGINLNSKVIEWKSEGKTIVVTFIDDKVVSKQQSGI
jgi:hypothetical protein